MASDLVSWIIMVFAHKSVTAQYRVQKICSRQFKQNCVCLFHHFFPPKFTPWFFVDIKKIYLKPHYSHLVKWKSTLYRHQRYMSVFLSKWGLHGCTNWNHVWEIQHRIFSCSLIKWHKIKLNFIFLSQVGVGLFYVARPMCDLE